MWASWFTATKKVESKRPLEVVLRSVFLRGFHPAVVFPSRAPPGIPLCVSLIENYEKISIFFFWLSPNLPSLPLCPQVNQVNRHVFSRLQVWRYEESDEASEIFYFLTFSTYRKLFDALGRRWKGLLGISRKSTFLKIWYMKVFSWFLNLFCKVMLSLQSSFSSSSPVLCSTYHSRLSSVWLRSWKGAICVFLEYSVLALSFLLLLFLKQRLSGILLLLSMIWSLRVLQPLAH